MHQRCLLLVISVVFAFAPPRSSRAEEGAADRLFRQGREAIVAGDAARGCALLAESDRLEPSPGAKLGLGLCEEQVEHFARAWMLLRSVVRSLPTTDERVSIATRHMTDIAPKLAFVTVVLTAPGVPGTRVASDIAELTSADLGTPLAFDPGPHFFQVSAPGRPVRRESHVLHAGEQLRVELTPPAPLSLPAPNRLRPLVGSRPPSSEPAPRSRALFAFGVGLEGAAAALLVSSLTTGALALGAKGDMNEACGPGGSCSQVGVNAAARGDAFAGVSTTTMIGAAVSAGVGALFILLDRHGPSKAHAFRATSLSTRF